MPAARYTDPEMLALEYERLWSRVWQIACRAEELPKVGDHVVYTIGARSVLLVRSEPDHIVAFHNACLHRGTQLADPQSNGAAGHFDDGCIRCPYHGWGYALDGRLVHVVDRDEFDGMPDGQTLAPVRCESFGGFVFVNFDADAPKLIDFLDPLSTLLERYQLGDLRLRGVRSTILPANWKAVVDAFNEGYHVQAAHSQILPWTDDTCFAYERLGAHSHYGRLAGARRALRPSPRLALDSDDYDEGAILAALVQGLGGAFLAEERDLVQQAAAESRDTGAPLLPTFQRLRRGLMESRGFAIDAFADDELTSADDVCWFPNIVGPIYPGSAIMFRSRPNGDDPNSAIHDTWVLEWPDARREPRPASVKFYERWTDRDWGEITEQDYRNLERVQGGMRTGGVETLRCNPVQEANVLHMHRGIDEYLRTPRTPR
jgi:nitrite reductase/ring-hydroxylating ferredoxin subunit